jgi:hypothetical protein
MHGEQIQPDKQILLEDCKKALSEILTAQEMSIFNLDLIYYADLLHNATIPSTYLTREEVKSDQTIRVQMKNALLNALTAKHLRDAMGPGEGLDKLDAFYESFFVGMKEKEENCKNILLEILLNKPDIIKEITQRVQEKLEEYPEDEILIVAHSGGSVFILQALWLLEKSGKIFKNVDDLYTIGSPAGLQKIREAMQTNFKNITDCTLTMATPVSIQTRWLNFSDILDPITFIDPKLQTNYVANLNGAHPIDFMIDNDWTIEVENVIPYHSIFGYLRNSKFGECVRYYLY